MVVTRYSEWLTDQAQQSQAMVINGSTIDQVKLNGALVSLREYRTVLEPRAEQRGGALHLMVDPAAVKRGYMVAFDSLAQADSYVAHRTAQQVAGLKKADRRSVAGEVAAAASASTEAASTGQKLGNDRVQLATCSIPNHLAKMYKDSACLGSALSVLWGDNIPDTHTYGFGDNISSLAIGDCISNLRVWINKNYLGGTTNYGGFAVYTYGTVGFNDNVSSLKADNNGIC